jgi:hypothetical protein
MHDFSGQNGTHYGIIDSMYYYWAYLEPTMSAGFKGNMQISG